MKLNKIWATKEMTIRLSRLLLQRGNKFLIFIREFHFAGKRKRVHVYLDKHPKQKISVPKRHKIVQHCTITTIICIALFLPEGQLNFPILLDVLHNLAWHQIFPESKCSVHGTGMFIHILADFNALRFICTAQTHSKKLNIRVSRQAVVCQDSNALTAHYIAGNTYMYLWP